MLTGIIIGLIVPVISFEACVFIFREGETFMQVLDRFVFLDVFTHIISLAAVLNLLVFFLFLWANKERSANGVIGATIIYAMIVAVLIFI